MNEKNWNKLKIHIKKQIDQASTIKTPVGNIIRHVWQDVKNKMYQIERKK